MRASIKLLDKAKTLCVPPTDYQLAKRLKIGHSTLSRCRNRGGTLDNEAATRLAELLGQDPYEVIAIMECERAKTHGKREFWESKLPRVLPMVAALGATFGVIQHSVDLGLTTKMMEERVVNTLYIMRSWLRRITIRHLRSRFPLTATAALV